MEITACPPVHPSSSTQTLHQTTFSTGYRGIAHTKVFTISKCTLGLTFVSRSEELIVESTSVLQCGSFDRRYREYIRRRDTISTANRYAITGNCVWKR